MLKVLLMALAIFVGMVGYDTLTPDSKPTTPPPSQKQKIEQHERSATKSILLAILPEKEKWPGPFQKAFLAIYMEDTIDPIRQSANWVPLGSMANDMPHALIAIEDHQFYQHGAIAIDGIIRAFLVNMTAGEVVQGGSTLTQQLVKNLFLTREQSMERKINEAFLSLVMESKYTKDEILELYLNTTYFGAGANGVKQAGLKYFDKVPSAFTLAECAVIAALPYAPSALNPLENPQGCKKRQLLVLQTMQKHGFITQQQLNEAKQERIYLTNGRYM